MVNAEEEDVVNNRKTYGTHMLSCGHEGLIVYKNSRKKTIGVEGIKGNCPVCGKRDKEGQWQPTVYLIRS